MTMFRTLRLGLGLAAASAAVSSCISPPSFPDTPSIEFKGLSVVRQPTQPGNTPQDSVIVTVRFKDGDGDLGLNQQEYTNPPYQRFNADGTLNPDHWNYVIKLFVKNPASGEFESYTRTPIGLDIPPELYYGQFPHLEPNAEKSAPLEGDLSFRQKLALGSPFFPGQEVRYEVTIRDRALNTSNTITTSSFVVVR